jgi:hypothetical protein
MICADKLSGTHHRIRNNYAIQAREDGSGKAGEVTNYWIDAEIPAAEIREINGYALATLPKSLISCFAASGFCQSSTITSISFRASPEFL